MQLLDVPHDCLRPPHRSRRPRFKLLQGEAFLAEYRFNTGVARHLFCKVCGVKSFYVPRSHPDGFSVNVRCLDPATIESMSTQRFDDARREESTAAFAHLSQEQ